VDCSAGFARMGGCSEKSLVTARRSSTVNCTEECATFILVETETLCAELVSGKYWPFFAIVAKPATAKSNAKSTILARGFCLGLVEGTETASCDSIPDTTQIIGRVTRRKQVRLILHPQRKGYRARARAVQGMGAGRGRAPRIRPADGGFVGVAWANPFAFSCSTIPSILDAAYGPVRTTKKSPSKAEAFRQRTLLTRLRNLVDFHDAGGLHDRGFLLPVGKTLRALAVDINPGELLAVMVIDRDLPMLVLPPPVFLGATNLFCRFLLHEWKSLKSFATITNLIRARK